MSYRDSCNSVKVLEHTPLAGCRSQSLYLPYEKECLFPGRRPVAVVSTRRNCTVQFECFISRNLHQLTWHPGIVFSGRQHTASILSSVAAARMDVPGDQSRHGLECG